MTLPLTHDWVHAHTFLITGGTGFIGGYLARKLTALGARVTVLARAGSDRSRLAGVSVDWFEADLTDAGTLTNRLPQVDYIINAAGMLGEAGVPEAAYHTLHVDGTRNLLAAIDRGRPPQGILHVSSPGVLGPMAADRPPAAEEEPLAPSNPYERSKAAAEAVVAEFVAAGLPIVTVRPEFIYGPGDLHVLGLFRAVQRGIFFYIGRGQNECHPTYIDDVANGIVLALAKGRMGEIYHIVGPKPVSFVTYAETIASALDVRPPWLRLPEWVAWQGALLLEMVGRLVGFRPPLSRTGVTFFSESRRFSAQKAAAELGYEAAYSLADGVAETVRWYRKEGLL